MDTFCYENILAHYYILPNVTAYAVSESQPTYFQVDLLENNHCSCNYPATMKFWKVKAFTNSHKYPKRYYHHLLFMYYPFRNEQHLKADIFGTYTEKINE